MYSSYSILQSYNKPFFIVFEDFPLNSLDVKNPLIQAYYLLRKWHKRMKLKLFDYLNIIKLIQSIGCFLMDLFNQEKMYQKLLKNHKCLSFLFIIDINISK